MSDAGGPRIILQKAIEATKARRFPEALELFVRVYSSGKDENSLDKSKYVEGLSYYGLALAMVEKKYKLAIEFCRKAADLQFYNSDHVVNLARVYMAAGMRKKAVDALEAAIQSMPDDEVVRKFRKEMGVRSRPAIPFLSRDNPLNIALGKARHRKKKG